MAAVMGAFDDYCREESVDAVVTRRVSEFHGVVGFDGLSNDSMGVLQFDWIFRNRPDRSREFAEGFHEAFGLLVFVTGRALAPACADLMSGYFTDVISEYSDEDFVLIPGLGGMYLCKIMLNSSAMHESTMEVRDANGGGICFDGIVAGLLHHNKLFMRDCICIESGDRYNTLREGFSPVDICSTDSAPGNAYYILSAFKDFRNQYGSLALPGMWVLVQFG
jgi:hypothetical protein